jgi:superfamily I DNA and/or RNA helicase
LQRAQIMDMIEKNFPEYKDLIKVGTPECHQGQEYYITCLSSVRTDPKQFANDENANLGFLACKERINVAISRARTLLVIFGKSLILERNMEWKQLVELCHNNGTYTAYNQ